MGPRPAFPLRACLLILWAVTVVNALHFYLDASERRCFIEELPTDTVVEGHYKALEWDEQQQKYLENSNLGMLVEVDEMESGHSVVRTRGPWDGKFTFTAHEAGDHSICLSATSSSSPNTHIKLYIDIVVGSTRPNIEQDRSHISNLAQKIRDLNSKLDDIRREQQYQREREANYRDLSEATNTRAVWYSVLQIGVLIATCVWQLRHLRNFFDDRKAR
ncbi:ERP1 [Sanghuangporus weigelae]